MAREKTDKPEVTEIKTVTIPAISSKNEAALVTFIGESLTHYKNGKLYAHMAACAALAYAAAVDIGSAKLLTVMYDKLGGFDSKESTDAMLFRSWIGRKTGFKVEKDGEEKPMTWVGFRKKAESETKPAGFFVKAGDKFLEQRKLFDLTATKTGLRFMDKVGGRGGSQPGLMELLEAIAAFRKRQDNRAEKVDVTIPESVENALKGLESAAKAEIAELAKLPTPTNIITSQSETTH